MELRGRRHSDGQPLEYFNPPSLPDSQLWHSDGQPLEYFNMVVRAEAPGAGTVRGLVVRVSDVSLGTGQMAADGGRTFPSSQDAWLARRAVRGERLSGI
jgi:hypothetical protein